MLERDRNGKPIVDSYMSIRFYDNVEPYFIGEGKWIYESGIRLLAFESKNVKGVDPTNPAGLTIRLDTGVLCYSWDTIREHWFGFNSKEYVDAITKFQNECQHEEFTSTVHSPFEDQCFHTCKRCDKRINPHKQDAFDVESTPVNFGEGGYI